MNKTTCVFEKKAYCPTNVMWLLAFHIICFGLAVTTGCRHSDALRSNTTIDSLRNELGGIRSESKGKHLGKIYRANKDSVTPLLEQLIASKESEDVLLAAYGYSLLEKDAISSLRKLLIDTKSTVCHGALIATYWLGDDAKHLLNELFFLLEYKGLNDELPNVVDALYLEGTTGLVCKTIARFPSHAKERLLACFNSSSPWTRSRACYVVEKMGKHGKGFEVPPEN